jgi:hypothetical protein
MLPQDDKRQFIWHWIIHKALLTRNLYSLSHFTISSPSNTPVLILRVKKVEVYPERLLAE